MQLVVRLGLVVAAIIEPHDGVKALLELGEDLLGLLPEAAGEEGLSAELNVDPLLELGIGIGDLGIDRHKEAGCGGQARQVVDDEHDSAGPFADDDRSCRGGYGRRHC